MTKKMFYFLVGSVLLLFIFSFTLSVPIMAQEEQKEEDIEDFSLEDLLNVEITTAGKQAEKISEIPASVVLVTREDIEKYGYQTLEEILSNIPGLYMTNDYLDANFGVRGFFTPRLNRNVVVLVNGVRQVDDVFSDNHLSSFPIAPAAIDRIEVVRGPMSVIYGTGAFFGVINIKTNIVDEKKPMNLAEVSYGSENTKRLVVRTSGKSGEFQYAFNGSFFDTDGIDVPYDSIGDPALLGAYGVAAGSTTEGLLENNNKYFNFSGTFKDFTFNASHGNSEKEIFLVLPSVGDGFQSYLKWTRVSFGYKKDFSEKTTFDAKFSFYESRWLLENEWLFPGYYGGEDDGSAGYEVNLNLFINPSDKLKLTFGVDYYNIFSANIVIDHPLFGLGFTNVDQHLADGEAVVTQSVFTQIDFKISDKLKIVAGARLEQVPKYTMEQQSAGGTSDQTITQATYDQTKAEFIPRFALIYSLNQNNIVKFLYGKAINRPSFFFNVEQLISPLQQPLSPETIQTFELNYIGSLSPRFSVSLSLFRNMLDQLIQRTFILNQDNSIIRYQANVGELTTNGLELTITAKPSDSFSFELSGTYQDTTDKLNEDMDVGYSPKWLGYFKAAYFITKDISLAVTGNYVDKMEAYLDSSLVPPARIGDPVDGYFILGANLRLRNLFGKGIYLNLRGSNLLDEELRYPTTANNSNFASKGTVGRGISFLLTLGWKF